MSAFGVKTKVVRTEILHILVPMGSRGDPYLTVSRTFGFLGFGVQVLCTGMQVLCTGMQVLCTGMQVLCAGMQV